MEELTIAYFNSTYDEMYDKVLAYIVKKCNNLDYVEDIAQETFGEFYKLLESRGVKYIKNRNAIVFRIAKTKVFKYYSLRDKLKKIVPLKKTDKEGSEYDYIQVENYDIEDKIVNESLLKEIWSIIKSMPVTVQKVFVLHYYFDKTIKEVAEELNLTESNVKHKLYRTIEKIRNIYKAGGML